MVRLVSSILLFIAAVAASSTVSAADDHAEIKVVIQKYFDGTSQGRPELVEAAFLPSLEVQWLGENGELRRRPAHEYIENIKPGTFVPRVGRVVSIDVTDAAAAVKAEILWNERLYTDYMLLLKVDGTWRISNKIATWRVL